MRYFAIILLVVFFGSCQNRERAKKPQDLISQDKMVDILTEISLVHGARSYNKQMLEQTGLDPDEYIWEKFDIDSAQFARSNSYYTQNYLQYQQIYDRVKLRLENLKILYDSLRQAEESERDSLMAQPRDSLRRERSRRMPDLDTIRPDTIIGSPSPLMSRGDATSQNPS